MDMNDALFTKEEYLKMFSESPVMQGARVKLLKYHFAQPNYLTSAPDLAKAMGYANFNAANLQYGSFAKTLITSMGWEDRIKDCDALYGLAYFYPPELPEHPYWEWELRPEAVEALKELGW